MKWWQQILVDNLTNTKVLTGLFILAIIVIGHFAGWHPERWISQAINWLTTLNPSEIFN